MPYTLFFLQFINISLAVASGCIYQFYTNLWVDRGLLVFSFLGFAWSAMLLIILGLASFKDAKMGTFSKLFNYTFSPLLFLCQTAMLGYVLWQKVI